MYKFCHIYYSRKRLYQLAQNGTIKMHNGPPVHLFSLFIKNVISCPGNINKLYAPIPFFFSFLFPSLTFL